jgi:hypothetical protein
MRSVLCSQETEFMNGCVVTHICTHVGTLKIHVIVPNLEEDAEDIDKRDVISVAWLEARMG